MSTSSQLIRRGLVGILKIDTDVGPSHGIHLGHDATNNGDRDQRAVRREQEDVIGDDAGSDDETDPITRAMRAADALDRETESLQPPNQDVDLTLKSSTQSSKPRSRSLSLSSIHYADLPRDQRSALILDTGAGDSGDEQMWWLSKRKRSKRSQLRGTSLRVASGAGFLEGQSSVASPEVHGGKRRSSWCVKVPVRTSSKSAPTFFTKMFETSPRQSGNWSGYPETDLSRGAAFPASDSDDASLSFIETRNKRDSPALEDITIHLASGGIEVDLSLNLNVAGSVVDQQLADGPDPMGPGDGILEDGTANDEWNVRATLGNETSRTIRDVLKRLDTVSLSPQSGPPVTPPLQPAQHNKSPASNLEPQPKIGDFDAVERQTVHTSFQFSHHFSLPLLLDLHSSMPNSRLPVAVTRVATPDADAAERTGPSMNGLILAIGAEDGVNKDFRSSVVEQIEKLDFKPSTPCQSSLLSLSSLTLKAMESFTRLPLIQQAQDNPFKNRALLASLMMPHIEAYLLDHVEVRFLVIEYTADHLSTVLALQILMGKDSMKVAGILNGDDQISTANHNVSLKQSRDGRLAPPSSRRVGGRGNHRGSTNVAGEANVKYKAVNDAAFSQADYLLTSAASESEGAVFVASVRDAFISVSDFYVPEGHPHCAKRRCVKSTGIDSHGRYRQNVEISNRPTAKEYAQTELLPLALSSRSSSGLPATPPLSPVQQQEAALTSKTRQHEQQQQLEMTRRPVSPVSPVSPGPPPMRRASLWYINKRATMVFTDVNDRPKSRTVEPGQIENGPRNTNVVSELIDLYVHNDNDYTHHQQDHRQEEDDDGTYHGHHDLLEDDDEEESDYDLFHGDPEERRLNSQFLLRQQREVRGNSNVAETTTTQYKTAGAMSRVKYRFSGKAMKVLGLE